MFCYVSNASNVNWDSLSKNRENHSKGLFIQLKQFLIEFTQPISIIQRQLINIKSLSNFSLLIKLIIIESLLKLLVLQISKSPLIIFKCLLNCLILLHPSLPLFRSSHNWTTVNQLLILHLLVFWLIIIIFTNIITNVSK